MPYSQFTLAQVASQISSDLDDVNQKFWLQSEVISAIYEAMLFWGATTKYWRSTGLFNLNPQATSPFYDISSAASTSTQMASLRTRNTTLNTVVVDIQNVLNERSAGISGAGMSGQTNISTILTAVQRARNRFVLDSHIPFSINTIPQVPPSDNGIYAFSQNTVYTHRVSWQDISTSNYTNLWRQDPFAYDKSYPSWPTSPGAPQAFSELENSPLKLQLYPPPLNQGTLEAVTVNSLLIDTTNASATFNVPDEWVNAIKYAALFELMSSDSQINDPLRADYCNTRYSQYVSFCQDASAIMRVTVNGKPVPLDSIFALDANYPYWRNQKGVPTMAGTMYDLLCFNPGFSYTAASVTCDVVQTAPLPSLFAYIQIGDEDLARIIDFATHILLFKCGGNEFKSTFINHDNFMSAIADRGRINSAKIMYMTEQFKTANMDNNYRPDIKKAKKKGSNA